MEHSNFIDSLSNYLKFIGKREAQLENGDDPFLWEFLKIRVGSEDLRNSKEFACDVGSRPENMKKNRYRDILPYDHSRVKIAPYADDSDSDYINASLIKSSNGSIGYIAAQGPMPETVNDFWQMIAEFGVKTILMLCDLFEGGKPKCHQYWPDLGSSAEYLHATVANTFETQPQEHFTIRHFTLTCYGLVTKIQQFHYHGWPDHGTPDEIQPLLDYLESVRTWQHENDVEPIVVHCSAGCGRSGTLCALDIVRTQLKNKAIPADFSVCNLVSDLRKQRIAMVQSKDQYVLLHQAIGQVFKYYLKDECYRHLNGSNDDSSRPLNRSEQESCPENVVDNDKDDIAADDNDDDQCNATTVYLNGSDQGHSQQTAPSRPPRTRKAALTSSIINNQRQQQKPVHSDSCSSSGLFSAEEVDCISLTKNASNSSVFTHNSHNNSNRSSPERTRTVLGATFKISDVSEPRIASPCDHELKNDHDESPAENDTHLLLDDTLTASDSEERLPDYQQTEGQSVHGESSNPTLETADSVVSHSFSSPNLQANSSEILKTDRITNAVENVQETNL